MLMRRGGFGRVELLDRAAELGLVATTRLFLGRCDLRSGRVELRKPSPARAFWYDALLVSERGHRGLAQFSAAVAAAPGRVMAVLRELPAAARQVRRARARLEPSWLEPEPAISVRAEARRLNRRTWRATQLGVRRALKLLGIDPGAHRELALACTHDSLLRRGFQVTRHGAPGDSWLEFSGQRLPVDQLLRGSVAAAQ